jgi:hypothetical protein
MQIRINKRVIVVILFLFISCLLRGEDSVWERSYKNFKNVNFNNCVLYAEEVISDGVENTKAILYLLSIIDDGGIIFEVENYRIINSFEFYYDRELSCFLLGDVHGGIWSIQEARRILNNIMKMQFKIIRGKDLLDFEGTFSDAQDVIE